MSSHKKPIPAALLKYRNRKPHLYNERTTQALKETETQLINRNRTHNTVNSVMQHLRQLADHTDLFDTATTTAYILTLKPTRHDKAKLADTYKRKLIADYSVFCHANLIPYDPPTISCESQSPIIPTTQQVNEIINTAKPSSLLVFTIMAETAIEGEELHQIHRNDISTETGRISVKGTKQHNNGIYQLKPRTAEMLREYIAKHPDPYPFPHPKPLAERWRRARITASRRLHKPELKTIQLKVLRNYAGATFYKTTGNHDPIATMRFMRHKSLDTTLHYLRSINLNEPEEYTSITIKLGEPDTLKRIEEASNSGYAKFTEADGYQIFRIRKTT